MKDFHCHNRVHPSYRPFSKRGVAVAMRKAGSSTAQGPEEFTMLHLHHLCEHGLAYLTELFKLLVAGVNIPAIGKDSVIIQY